MSNNTEALTVADNEALTALPDGCWFTAIHLPINRPQYRCERLENRGKLESRVTGEYPHLTKEYRKLSGNQQ